MTALRTLKTKGNATWKALALCLLAVAGLVSTSMAQMAYFNEWYQPQQSYVKLTIAADGLYRVHKADLQASGVSNLAALNRANIQLFYRGQEVPVYVQDSLGGGLDYFEFVGRRNDGGLDTLLYRQTVEPFGHDPSQQPHIHTSFFTDTSAYFLTWDAANTQGMEAISPSNFGAYLPQGHFRHRVLVEYNDKGFFVGGGGSTDINNVLNPDYITGEGFVSNELDRFSIPDAVGKIVRTPGFANTGNPTRIEVRMLAVNNCPEHVFAVEVDFVDRYRDTTAYINIGTFGFDYQLPLNPNTLVRHRVYGTNTSIPDKQRVAWFTLEYDRTFDMDTAHSVVMRQWNHSDTTYLRLYNARFNSQAWIYDQARNERIAATVVGDTLKFLVPGHPTARDLYFFTDRAIRQVGIEPSPALENLSDVSAGAEFVILTHRNFANSAYQYAAYRETDTVNQMSAKVVFIDQVYDEFGYGSLTSWAIKNFCRYAMENWTIKPRHFMLWGKGRGCPRDDNRDNYIPIFGTPANDWEYVTNMRYDTVDLVPRVGMGRVSLYNDQQGLDYLNKVRDYEHQPYDVLYKEVLMMGGGKNNSEQGSIADANIDKFLPILEGEPMGGKVYFHQKWRNGDSTNTSLSTEQHINAGVGLLHYYGHSATNIFELDVLEPSRYTNFHKYPFMIAFGCSGGNFSEQGQSYGERMILQPDRGAIGYLGNTTSGFVVSLTEYGKYFYGAMMGEGYGASIGEVFEATLENYTALHHDIYGQNHAKQLDFQGDPSVSLKLPMKPDLRVQVQDVFFPDGDPQALASTFRMRVIVHNDGRTFADSFAVTVRQRLPSGAQFQHDTVYFRPLAYIDTLELYLPNPHGLQSAGTNQFTVVIDATDTLDEIFEGNNIAVQSQLFFGNLATPLFPAEYAIVGEQTLYLQASGLSMNLPSPIYYHFEIDTVSTFDSPFKKSSGSIQGNAALGEWPIGFNMTPQQVYYWRVQLAGIQPVQWVVSSFKYVPGKIGWSQSQAPQMTKDETKHIHLDEINQEWQFEGTETVLHALISSFPSNGAAAYFLGSFGSEGGAGNGVLTTPIDQYSLHPLVHAAQPYGDWWFTAAPSPSSPASPMAVAQTIAQMKMGDYFLLASSGNPLLGDWPDAAIQAFELVGAHYVEMRALTNADRLLFFGRKGAVPGTATVISHPNLPVTGRPPMHDLLRTLTAAGDQGSIQSTIIGPSSDWTEIDTRWISLDAAAGDSQAIAVYGIRRDDTEELLLQKLPAGRHSLAGIDARSYPNLRMLARLEDGTNFTAPQLDHWEVYHAPVTDLAIDGSLGLVLPDTITEGQRLQLRFFLRNLTSVPCDSMWVKYGLQQADRSYIALGSRRYGTLQGKDVRQIEFAANTSALGLQPGEVTLIIEVNPGRDPLEQYHFNNLYYHPIHVLTDQIGPIVDVTIDGKHMMSGDIISPEPEITIQINDDSPYLPVTVSDSTFRIWFGTERSYRTNPMVTIEGNDSIDKAPVRMPENKTRLTFKPGRLPDGEYTLAVQGYDLKGNEAAARPYVVQMNVVNEKAISEVLPYPNPFSTACHFAFTLTGDERPSRFDIEIYTVTGKLVKVVDLLATGDVHFGYNITQYAWDGRDEYGDLLANGVYIYKVNTRFQDRSTVKMRDEGISDYFRNGYGKMYLMR